MTPPYRGFPSRSDSAAGQTNSAFLPMMFKLKCDPLGKPLPNGRPDESTGFAANEGTADNVTPNASVDVIKLDLIVITLQLQLHTNPPRPRKKRDTDRPVRCEGRCMPVRFPTSRRRGATGAVFADTDTLPLGLRHPAIMAPGEEAVDPWFCVRSFRCVCLYRTL